MESMASTYNLEKKKGDFKKKVAMESRARSEPQ
jgi:hypothetical protein